MFYERQGEELGEYFFNTLFSDIDSLILFPEKHSTIFGYHRLLSKRFPFSVYYKIQNDVVTVYRVLDQRHIVMGHLAVMVAAVKAHRRQLPQVGPGTQGADLFQADNPGPEAM